MLDLVFVIDSSGSIRDNNPPGGNPDNWALMLNFMTSVVDGLTVSTTQTRIGVVKFSNKGESEFYLNRYSNAFDVNAHIRGISYVGGNTNTSGGLREMTFEQFGNSDRGDRADVTNVAIVITDGVSTFDKERTIPDAVEARNRNIQIFSVGITAAIDENELQRMSSMPQEKDKNYFTSASFGALDEIRDAVLTQTCRLQGSGENQCVPSVK